MVGTLVILNADAIFPRVCFSRFTPKKLILLSGIPAASCSLKNLGKKNIPDKGSYMIVSNHVSNKDPFILASGKLKPLTFIAKERWKRES